MANKKIILVDDNPSNLTACKKTLKDLYEVYPAPSAEKMFDLLKHVMPDMILLDVEMPDINGYEAMRELKKNDEYKDIPVIFLSAMDDAQSEIEGLNLGAVDYIHKPFIGAVLIRRIKTHMSVIEGKKELLALNNSIEKLLTQTAGDSNKKIEVEDEAIRELLSKSEVLSRMGHEIRAPLNTIIKMIETAVMSIDMDNIKHCLGVADAESRLILQIVNNILDIQRKH